MVFRKLQLGLAIAALIGAACGSDGTNTSASIEMEIDSQSCFTGAEGLRLNCPSTAIVVVQDQRGDTIAEDCATLPEGRLVNSADVIANTLSLGSLPSDTPLTIGLAIHSGIINPCPQDVDPSSSPFLFGSTELVTLQQQESGIPLLLRCASGFGPGTSEPPANDACEECGNNLQACLAIAGLSSCDAMVANCDFQCVNSQPPDRCFQTCNLLRSFCVDTGAGDDGGAGGIELNCGGDQSQCLEFCQGQPPGDICPELCFDASQQCEGYKGLQSQCTIQHESCLDGCEGPGGSCLGLSF